MHIYKYIYLQKIFAYIYICIYIYVPILYMCIYMHIRIESERTCIPYVYVCKYIYIYVCMHCASREVCLYVSIYIWVKLTNLWRMIPFFPCVSNLSLTFTSVFINICIYIYTLNHTYIQSPICNIHSLFLSHGNDGDHDQP